MFADYRLLILPDQVRLTEELARRLDAYRAAGGRLLLSAASGLKTVDTVGEILSGTVLIRSHGAAPAQITTLKEKGFKIYTSRSVNCATSWKRTSCKTSRNAGSCPIRNGKNTWSSCVKHSNSAC